MKKFAAAVLIALWQAGVFGTALIAHLELDGVILVIGLLVPIMSFLGACAIEADKFTV